MSITIRSLIKQGAIFFVNHSGGKDSQAMYIRLKKIIPADQLVVIHATLGEIEWPGTIEHIENTINGVEFHTCKNPNKTFLSMVEKRGRFPDKSRKQCTSDLKRDPLNTCIRRVMKAKGKTLVVNCMGMRAAESNDRKKLDTFKYSERNSKAGRVWYEWLPIHKMSTPDVFKTIEKAGEKPHWAYASGMTRLSCSFCIMASIGDLCTAAQLRPELYKKYVDLEIKLGHSLQMSGKKLPELTGINA